MQVASRMRFPVRFAAAVAAGLALLAGSPATAQPSNVDFTVSGTSTVRAGPARVAERPR